MKLVDIRENAIAVELDWQDCTLLAYLIREALSCDALHDADNWSLTYGYARTAAALLETAGLASWAHTVKEDEYTLEPFRTVAPVTKDNRAKRQARRAWRHTAPPPEGDTAPVA